MFSASGEVLKTMGRGELEVAASDFTGVAIRGGAIFAQDYTNSKCILYK